MMKTLKFIITPFFFLIVMIRNKLYDWKLLPIINSNIPIVSVGNIQVGGSGKTPFVIALIKQLIQNNINPIIITRGYKRNTNHQIILNNIEKYSAQAVGDEPYYMKQVLKNTLIIIDHNKKNAIKTANQLQNIDCIILDDGFQSRYLNKNLDIVLINTFPKKNNLMLMPNGYLREPISSLGRSHFIYTTKGKSAFQEFGAKHLEFNFKIIKYKNGKVEKNIKNNLLSPLIAFCGIANSKHFLSQLSNMNIKFEQCIKFENHLQYNKLNYEKLKNYNPNHLSFITTYKDFVKLDDEFKDGYTIYVLEMNLELNDQKLINKIKGLLNEN